MIDQQSRRKIPPHRRTLHWLRAISFIQALEWSICALKQTMTFKVTVISASPTWSPGHWDWVYLALGSPWFSSTGCISTSYLKRARANHAPTASKKPRQLFLLSLILEKSQKSLIFQHKSIKLVEDAPQHWWISLSLSVINLSKQWYYWG